MDQITTISPPITPLLLAKRDLGSRIMTERKRVGYDTRELARLVPVARPILELMESGNYKLSLFSPLGVRITRIADALCVSLKERQQWIRLVDDIWLEHWADRI